MGHVTGDVADVAHDRGGGGEAPGTASVEHRVAHHVAAHHRGVEDAVHAREHVVEGDERGVDAHLDVRIVLGDDREQLDAVAEVGRVLHVLAGEVPDALHLHLVERRLEAVGEGAEDAGLVRRVEAVDVERGIRLGISELLGVGQDFVEGTPLVLHAREDVVAGAVEDAVDLLDLVAGKALAHGADDRDAAAHGGAEVDVHPVLRGRVEDLLSVFGEKLLVGRDDGLPGVEGREDERLRNAGAADRLDDDLHGGIGDDALRVRRQYVRIHRHAAVRRDVQVRDLPQHDVHAQAFRHDPAVAQKTLRHARADRAKPQDANSNFFHHSFSLFNKFSS